MMQRRGAFRRYRLYTLCLPTQKDEIFTMKLEKCVKMVKMKAQKKLTCGEDTMAGCKPDGYPRLYWELIC